MPHNSKIIYQERGAFTGAVARKISRVETAHTRTLLLDEVGEMPLEMQVNLLTFLQEFPFERVGSTKKIFADVRVIAATDRNLHQALWRRVISTATFSIACTPSTWICRPCVRARSTSSSWPSIS